MGTPVCVSAPAAEPDLNLMGVHTNQELMDAQTLVSISTSFVNGLKPKMTVIGGKEDIMVIDGQDLNMAETEVNDFKKKKRKLKYDHHD
jgi:hypothetical protein